MDEPLSETVGVAQVIVCVAPALAAGGVVLLPISCVAVDVQPLAGSVTVTVYVPAELTAGVAVAAVKPPGPLQL